MSPLSPNCSRLHSNRQNSSPTCPQSLQNRSATPHNALNRLSSPQIQFKSTQITSKLLSIALNRQNFILKLRLMLSTVPFGHKFNTTCPKIVSKLLYSSPVTQLRLQTSQNIPKHRKLSRNRAKLMQIIAKCPPLIRKSPFYSFCDITECLTSPSSAPKSTPIITKRSQIIKSAPSIQSPPLKFVVTHSLRYHSISLPS